MKGADARVQGLVIVQEPGQAKEPGPGSAAVEAQLKGPALGDCA